MNRVCFRVVAKVTFRVDPEFVGPMSVGTVLPIKLLRAHLDLELAPAKRLIDRAVFDGEEVELEFPSREAAKHFVDELNALPGPARFQAAVVGS